MDDDQAGMFDAVCLFEVSKGQLCYLLDFLPAKYDIGDVLTVTTLSAIPKEEISGYSTHCFNVGNTFGNVLSFTNEDGQYSIVILSKEKLPFVFLSCLEELGEMTQTKMPKTEPIELLRYQYALMRTWRKAENNILEMESPTGPNCIQLTIQLRSYLNYSPFGLLPSSTDFKKLWEDLLSGRGVLIIGDTAKSISKAALSVMSLAAPFIFMDEVIIAPNPNDPRLQDISSEVYLVATTSNRIPPNSREFSSIIRLNNEASKPSIEYCEECRDRGDLLYKVMKHINSLLVAKNPYNALLFRGGVREHYEELLSGHIKNRCLDLEDAVLFEKSATFKFWQHKNMNNNDVRSGLLSNSPDELFSNEPLEDLVKFLSIIEDLRLRFRGDEHVLSIMRNHKKKIAKLITGRT